MQILFTVPLRGLYKSSHSKNVLYYNQHGYQTIPFGLKPGVLAIVFFLLFYLFVFQRLFWNIMMQGQPLEAISVNNLMKLAERICKVAMTNLAQLNTKKSCKLRTICMLFCLLHNSLYFVP